MSDIWLVGLIALAAFVAGWIGNDALRLYKEERRWLSKWSGRF